ncbi:MAG: rod shape-determining protein RodA [Pyrinomonadaceae bacterium]|nr:rod shape-determining protein RodA [Pyrinomonadaceae bacterium]
MSAILEKRSLRDFDWLLTLLAIAIVCFGVLQIRNAQPLENYWEKQLIGLGIALIVMLAIAFTDYRKLVDAAPIFYGVGLFLLIIVLIPNVGMRINGQQAWIKVPFIGQFQPSEFVKIPVVLMLAKYFGGKRVGTLTIREMALGIGILAAPLGLILLEPDAGQAITYFPLLAAVFFLSAIRMRLVLAVILLGVVGIPLAWVIGTQTGVIKSYQIARVEAILDPENVDPRGFGYQTVQSIVSVGKGGLNGSESDPEFSQSALKFLPEPHTDFIFAVTAENTGFVGCIALLLAYIFLISRLLNIARQSPDRVGMLVIMAFAAAMTFQIFMNVGMTVGLLPVIGVPLPLMSAGLSAILATFIAIGFAVSVRMRRFVN